jgi:hypothetical protein
MWTPLRQEIEQVRKKLNISSERFHAVPLNEWNRIQQNILEKFCYPNNVGWIWEKLKKKDYAIQFEYENSFVQLLKVVDGSEKVWLFLNETVSERTKYWFYEGFISEIVSILYESSLINEVYVASKKYEWLLCINHHDYLIATGETIAEKLMTTSTK